MLELIALCVAWLVVGIAAGMAIMFKKTEGRRFTAPAPVDPGYDPENPMNRGRGRETVEICGATWYLM